MRCKFMNCHILFADETFFFFSGFLHKCQQEETDVSPLSKLICDIFIFLLLI